MKAVWSFWTKPFKAYQGCTWRSKKYQLFSFLLSLESVRKFYPDTTLFTDDDGARVLVDAVGLEFNSVLTTLNALQNHPPEFWTLGKLYTYQAQTEPFMHLDNDVYLWGRLPEGLTESALFAQNPEFFSAGSSYYKPEQFEAVLNFLGGWVPKEWQWYRATKFPQRGECCGIVGGNRVDFIGYFARLATQLIEHPANQPLFALYRANGWSLSTANIEPNVLVEQYLLAACLEFHKNRARSPYRDVDINYLFQSREETLFSASSKGIYTHLMADTKMKENVMTRLEKRVMRDYPNYYERCIKFADTW